VARHRFPTKVCATLSNEYECCVGSMREIAGRPLGGYIWDAVSLNERQEIALEFGCTI
jgi:hypothetical protein